MIELKINGQIVPIAQNAKIDMEIEPALFDLAYNEKAYTFPFTLPAAAVKAVLGFPYYQKTDYINKWPANLSAGGLRFAGYVSISSMNLDWYEVIFFTGIGLLAEVAAKTVASFITETTTEPIASYFPPQGDYCFPEFFYGMYAATSPSRVLPLYANVLTGGVLPDRGNYPSIQAIKAAKLLFEGIGYNFFEEVTPGFPEFRDLYFFNPYYSNGQQINRYPPPGTFEDEIVASKCLPQEMTVRAFIEGFRKTFGIFFSIDEGAKTITARLLADDLAWAYSNNLDGLADMRYTVEPQKETTPYGFAFDAEAKPELEGYSIAEAVEAFGDLPDPDSLPAATAILVLAENRYYKNRKAGSRGQVADWLPVGPANGDWGDGSQENPFAPAKRVNTFVFEGEGTLTPYSVVFIGIPYTGSKLTSNDLLPFQATYNLLEPVEAEPLSIIGALQVAMNANQIILNYPYPGGLPADGASVKFSYTMPLYRDDQQAARFRLDGLNKDKIQLFFYKGPQPDDPDNLYNIDYLYGAPDNRNNIGETVGQTAIRYEGPDGLYKKFWARADAWKNRDLIKTRIAPAVVLAALQPGASRKARFLSCEYMIKKISFSIGNKGIDNGEIEML